MTKQLRPIIHGRDHRPDGADPIGCVCVPPSAGGTFESVVTATSDLIAYWRLGETGEPFADTSGYGPSIAEPDADLTIEDNGGTPAAPTPNITGALATDDDGAVEFNYDGTSAFGGQWLQAAAAPGRFTLTDMTVAAWVKVKASALTRRGLIVGNSADGGTTQLGWGLQAIYPGRSVRFTRGHAGTGSEKYAETPGGVTADTWYLAIGTYDGDTIRLYMNAVLVDETADALGSAVGGEVALKLGYGNMPTTQQLWFYGSVDEAAVWNRALSQDEIDTLYEAGVGGLAPGSRVVISDGEGGATWGQVATDAIADTAVTPAKIEPGSDGQVLTSSGGAATWADPAGGGGGSPTGPAGGVLDGSYPNPGLAATVAGPGLTETSDVLSVNVDGSTLEVASDTVRVKDDGITAAKIAAAAVGPSELADTAVTPGSYGDATHVGQFTVDQDGRLTAATNVAVSAGGGLPAVGAAGEVLTVVSGAWASAPPTIEVEY